MVKLREVRRSGRFQSRLRTQSRRRQEYVASMLSTALVQGILSISLFVAAYKAYQAVSSRAESVGLLMILALPLLFTLGGLWCARLFLRNIRGARELWSARKAPPPAE